MGTSRIGRLSEVEYMGIGWPSAMKVWLIGGAYTWLLVFRSMDLMLPLVNQCKFKTDLAGFPGGLVVKSSPANEEDTGLIPDPGRFHMPWSN